jgi:pyruvate formate lyase activating enzyme
VYSAFHAPIAEDDPWSYVRGLQSGSLCDWPGRVSAILFLGGCNLRCPTCHNACLAWTPEQYPLIPKNSVQHFLQTRASWLDGLVVSGGEPTCVPQINALVQELSTFGLPIKLDTNGLRPKTVASLLSQGLIQAVAVDVKGPWAKYPQLTGGYCSPQKAQSSLEAIFDLARRMPQDFYFRCTAVPGLNASDVQTVQQAVPSGYTVTIQTYIPPENTSSSCIIPTK